jgi:hypothetical protein
MVVELVLLVAIAVSVFAFVLAPLLRPEAEPRQVAEQETDENEQHRDAIPADNQPVHESS